MATAASADLASSALAASAPGLSALSGYWKLEGQGNWPAPALTAWAKAEMKKTATKGDVDVEAVRWCVFQGMPYVMDNAGPIELRVAPQEVALVAERIAVIRHLYLGVAKHPSEDVFDNTVVGNSLAKWIGGALTVDTMGFKDGVGPAGAPRTESGHLVERFRLLNGGKTLSVVSTWTDPKVFTRPYVYTLTYQRLPSDYTPVEYYCDPRDHGVGHK